MRFDVEAFRQLFPELTSVTTVFAGGGVVFATLIVAYGALVGTGETAAEAEMRTTSVVEGSVFTPVTTTQSQPVATATVTSNTFEAAREPISHDPDDPRSIAYAVQSHLKRAGCYGGPLNGIWTTSTRAAMGEFTARANARLPVDRADPVLLALVEAHRDVTCNDGAPPAESAELSRDTERAGRSVELHTSSVSTDRAARAEHLSYSNEDRRALDTLAATDPDRSADEFDATGATGAAATAAAGAAASKAVKPERRAKSSRRKYKRQPSLSRQVSRGFRSIQRSLNKIF